MADVKISALPAASTPLAGTEVLPIVQNGTTDKVSVANLTAGRTVDAAAVSVGAGTASAPSITPAGDSNTGVFFPAADTISFAEGGVESLRLDSSGNATFVGTAAMASSYLRNRIINGDMRIDQRNAGASVTVSTATVTYMADRWNVYEDTSGAISSQQSTIAPTGFTNSLLTSVTSAGTATAAQSCRIQQRIEGFNIYDLAYGTPSAATITVSFWVRSSLTGTYCVGIRNSAVDRSYVATYTISSANTWEQKSITIAGDTAGTWLTTNGIGMFVSWDLGSGSGSNTTAGSWVAGDKANTSAQVNWCGTNGATFYLTGVQLEVGTAATPFERRQYGQELLLCQRYYEQYGPGYRVNLGTTANTGSTGTVGAIRWLVRKRASPTVSVGGTWRTLGANLGAGTSLSFGDPVPEGASMSGTVGSGYIQGQANMIQSDDTATGFVQVSAEL